MTTAGTGVEFAFSYTGARPRMWSTLYFVVADFIGVELALCLGYFFYRAIPFHAAPIGPPQYMGLSLGILTLPLAYWSVGLYPAYGIEVVQRMRTRVYATLLVFAVLLLWNYIVEHGVWSRGILFSTMVFALSIPSLLSTAARRLLIHLGLCGAPVLVIGGGEAGEAIVKSLFKNVDLGLRPVAILDDDRSKWGTTIADVPVAGPIRNSIRFQEDIRIAVIALQDLDKTTHAGLLQSLAFPTVIVVPDLAGVQTLWTVSRDLGGLLGLEVRKKLLLPGNRIVKRSLDCLLAIPALLLAAPLIALSAVWIKLGYGGPCFYSQQREGEKGGPIRVWKLRTMFSNAEELLDTYLEEHPEERFGWSQHFKLRKDPRVLPGIGTFLRKVSLDELPQLWNVIKGEMSLVGPRPFPYYHLEKFSSAFRTLRRSVRPGITGLWQVSERSDGDLSIQEARDTYYIGNWSIWLDVYILLRTIRTVLKPKGAY